MSNFPTTPQNPELVQPGGGRGMTIEMAWAKLRRGLLRLLRPGYVRRMAALRQGTCERYGGQVIDYRDLKYIRPVCGISFPPEAQPHFGQPFLGLARYGLCEVVVFTTLFMLLGGGFATLACLVHWAFWVPLGAIALVWLEIMYFFRDPERTCPVQPDAVICPADGRVTDVEEVDEVEFPGKMLRISIFLSIFNVHVNRMPWSGKITQVRYFPGAFLDARHLESATRNEQLWIDAEDASGLKMRVKQISGKIARRIVCWLKPGDEPKRGERIGMIKLGSRTDLLIPLERVAEVCVKVGDKVTGAMTVMARLKAAHEEA